MRRETQNILLVLLGGALLKIAFTGAYLNYVKPSHRWLLITGGAIMVGLALLSIARDLVGARAGAIAGHDHDHAHPSSGAWLLLLPVLAVFLVAPPALGADSVTRNASANRPVELEGAEVFPPLPPGDVIALPMSEFSLRAAWDKGNSLDNRQIKLTGFIVHDAEATYVARLTIGCCAADAFPIKVRLDDNPDAAALPDDTWVQVTVTYKPGTATRENDFVPAATALSLTQIPQPEDPYEH
jgi:uncharacterized repeat protein (TIGR03943 family)